MEWNFWTLLAFLPPLLIPLCVYALGWGHQASLPVIFAITAVLAMLVWQMPFTLVAASLVQGLGFSLLVIFTLSGPLFFSEVLKQTKTVPYWGEKLKIIHPDRRVQVIVIAWLMACGFDSFLGYGLAAVATTFLLLGVGFPPACAMMMGVLGTIPASAFSMMGTPLLLGVKNGLSHPSFMEFLIQNGVSMEQYLNVLAGRVGIIHGIAGIFAPLIMVMMMTRFFGRRKSWTTGLAIAPFAIFSGLAFTVPYTLTAVFIGPQFPPLVGSVVGLAIVLTAIRLNFLLPGDRWDFYSSAKQTDWSAGTFSVDIPSLNTKQKIFYALPLVLLITALLISRTEPVASLLQNITWSWNIFGTMATLQLQPFYLPCTIIVASVGAVVGLLFRLEERHWKIVCHETFLPCWYTTINLMFLMPIICVYANSGVNQSGLPSMFFSMAGWLGHIPGGALWVPFLTTTLGALGSLFADSEFYSSLALSSFQFELSQSTHISSSWIIALQLAGAGAGNMLAMHFLVRSALPVGMVGWEGPMFRKTLKSASAYILLISLIGVVLINGNAILSLFKNCLGHF